MELVEELRIEIKKLRFFGSQLSNICYNLSQHEDRVLRQDERETMAYVTKQWDAIERVN